MNTPNTLPQRFGPWSVVTGASDGIGRAFAMELVRRGVNLVLVARRQAVLEELAAKLQREHGVACDAVSTDLSRPAGDPKLVSRTKDRDVGLLVAAAGFGTSGPFLDNSVDGELEMIDVTCRAVAALAHAYGGWSVARGGGGLVLMSSLLAFQGVPRAANYAATKAHVQVLAEGLRRELAPANVEVLAVAPGPIDSGFAARARMTMRISENPEVVAHGALAALGRRGTTRPGRLSKLLEGSLAILPRQLRTRIMGQVMAGMTKCA